MSKEKTEAELLKEKLCLKKDHFDERFGEETAKADEFCAGYMEFLGTAKTERECNAYIIEKAKKNGFTAFDRTKSYKPGDKVYYDNRG